MTNRNETIVLVIEDSDILRLMLKKRLSNEGFQVFSAPGGREALQLMKALKVSYIISDLEMPTGDGASLFATLKQRDNKIPILVLTGYEEAVFENYRTYGIQKLLHKPIDDQVFNEIIHFLTSS